MPQGRRCDRRASRSLQGRRRGHAKPIRPRRRCPHPQASPLREGLTYCRPVTRSLVTLAAPATACAIDFAASAWLVSRATPLSVTRPAETCTSICAPLTAGSAASSDVIWLSSTWSEAALPVIAVVDDGEMATELPVMLVSPEDRLIELVCVPAVTVVVVVVLDDWASARIGSAQARAAMVSRSLMVFPFARKRRSRKTRRKSRAAREARISGVSAGTEGNRR